MEIAWLILVPVALLGLFAFIDCNTVDEGEDLDALRAVPDPVETERTEVILTEDANLFDASETGQTGLDLDVRGLGGTDEIRTGSGDDLIDLGPPGDEIGPDIQRASGGEGDDWITGSGGDDDLFGNEGDDVVFAGRGSDLIADGFASGGRSPDLTPLGGPDNDYYNAGSGDDTIVSAFGEDTLIGGRGDDVQRALDLGGVRGADALFGDSGDDTLYGDDGDILVGGRGADHFIIDMVTNGRDSDAQHVVEIYDLDADNDILTIRAPDISNGFGDARVDYNVLFGGVEIVLEIPGFLGNNTEDIALLRDVSGSEFEELRDRGGFRVEYG